MIEKYREYQYNTMVIQEAEGRKVWTMYILYQRLATLINGEDADTTEYHIASVMMENMDHIVENSIGEIAKLCNVSKSTISKFVRGLGFEDYTDFKWAAMGEKKKEIYTKDGSTINITDFICQNGVNTYMDVLARDIRHLFEGADFRKIDALVRDIHEYKKVAAFGEVYSETAALNFQYKMSLYRKFVYTTIDDMKQTRYIENAEEDTVLVIFSNSGRYINVYSRLEGCPKKTCFDKTKAKVVLVTSNEKMRDDPRVDDCLILDYSDKVQNHPILYQLLIEQIALRYQQIYGFPQENTTEETEIKR